MTSDTGQVNLKQYIRDVPDFPRHGILFKDLTPLLADARAFQASIDGLTAMLAGLEVDHVVAAEARGFLFGAPLALALGAGFIPVRKPGKLPYHTVAQEYALEYGTDRLEMHSDAIGPGQRVLLFDDVLATGGTMKACCDLVTGMGGTIVACAFALELSFLEGRNRLVPHEIRSLLTY